MSLRQWQEVQEMLRRLTRANARCRRERDLRCNDLTRSFDVDGGNAWPSVHERFAQPWHLRTPRTIERNDRPIGRSRRAQSADGHSRRSVIDPHLARSISKPPVSRQIERGLPENSGVILSLGNEIRLGFETVTSQSASQEPRSKNSDGRNLLKRWKKWLLRLDSNQQLSG
jgi:hypothetical protein